jgi:hypothetical protein
LLSEKLAYEPKRRPAVSAALHQHLEDLAFVDRSVGKELRMRATRLFPTIFALSVLLSAHAVGETLGDARVGFSAERLLVVDVSKR